ncbi:MAG: type II toxin-antitoxin system prevent-host-death family antitoxin [Verrucomicrobiota bacterium]
MKLVTISEAKAKLSALIDSVEKGEQVLIMRGSRPAVTLTPVCEDELQLRPDFSTKALNSFEEEIQSERKHKKLILVGKSTKEAAQALKRMA